MIIIGDCSISFSFPFPFINFHNKLTNAKKNVFYLCNIYSKNTEKYTTKPKQKTNNNCIINRRKAKLLSRKKTRVDSLEANAIIRELNISIVVIVALVEHSKQSLNTTNAQTIVPFSSNANQLKRFNFLLLKQPGSGQCFLALC